MVIENDPSARMQVRSCGDLVHPGACMVCGNGTCEAGYLDLGVFFDYEGTMYLCMTCVYQAGETVGLFTPEEVKGLHQIGERLIAENAEMKAELDAARPVLEYLYSLRPLTADGRMDHQHVNEEPEQIDVVTSFPLDSAVDGESKSEEPTTEPGRDDSPGFEPSNHSSGIRFN